MTPTETTTILRQFNVWRRGADIPQPDPREIGDAIDAAVEMIERLEAAEKAVTEAYQRGYATGQEEVAAELEFAKKEITNLHDDISEWMDKCDDLRAKIEQMEKHGPVAKVTRNAAGQIRLEDVQGNAFDLFENLGATLYALPGAQAQPAPSMPEVTDAMALAFPRALTDGSIGAREVEEIKDALRAALAAAPNQEKDNGSI